MKLSTPITAHREFVPVEDGVYTLKVVRTEIRQLATGDRLMLVFATEKGARVSDSWPLQGDASKYLAEVAEALFGEGVVVEDTDDFVGKTMTGLVRTDAKGFKRVFPRSVKPAAKADAPASSDDAPVTE